MIPPLYPTEVGNTMASRVKAAPALPQQTVDGDIPAEDYHTKTGVWFLKKLDLEL